jgi:hypothetical protein
MDKETKPVTLVCINPCKVDGKHIGVGEILANVEYELAMDLTGAGRTRVATEDDLAASEKKAAKKAEKPAP